jgi:hypothetical protein
MSETVDRQARQAQLLRVLEQEKSNFSKFEEHERIKTEAWQDELVMLKCRVQNQYELLALPGGDSIAVRTCLTEAEEGKLSDLFIRAFGKQDSSAPYELIELCTANPHITAEWLKANPSEFSTQDMLDVLYGYLERKQAMRQETANRVMAIASFRIQRDRKESS